MTPRGTQPGPWSITLVAMTGASSRLITFVGTQISEGWNPRGRGFVRNNVYRQLGRSNEPDPRVVPGQRAIEAPPPKQ